MKEIEISGIGTGKWSNDQAPQIGDRVNVTMNGLGTGTIEGFFLLDGFIGVKVKPDPGQRPDWHIKQCKNRKFTHYMVFGAEIKFI